MEATFGNEGWHFDLISEDTATPFTGLTERWDAPRPYVTLVISKDGADVLRLEKAQALSIDAAGLRALAEAFDAIDVLRRHFSRLTV